MVKYKPPSVIEVALYALPEVFVIIFFLSWYSSRSDVGIIWYVLFGVNLVAMIISSIAYRINHKLDWMIEQQNKNGQ